MNAPFQVPPIATPVPQPKPTTHDITITTTKKHAQARVLGVPAEEWGISRNTRSMEDCNYCFHDIVTKTEQDYVAEGFDEDQIKALETYTGNTDIETLSRDTVEEHQMATGEINSATRLVRTTEHYIRMDYEGSGRAGLYLVITGGVQGEVLKKDKKVCVYPIDVIPFATWCPIPIPHRFFGKSIADLTVPIQREKTALKRGALDNLYLHNNPRVEVAEANAGPNTLDDLLISRPGGVVRTKTAGGLNWQEVPDITPSIYPMLQYLDAELEQRTGLSKQSQGLDANALQNQSATAVAQVFNASQMRMKLIARQLAQGVKEIVSLLHHTIRTHGQEAQTLRLRNEWVQVDPRNWKTRDDMTINVGLGTGGKAQQFAQLMALANIQKELIAGGKLNLVDDAGLFHMAEQISKVMGYKNADQFFNDPTAVNPQTGQPLHPPVPPPPDPKLQIEQMKLNATQQQLQQKGQLDAQKQSADLQMTQFKAQTDAEHQKAKLIADAALADKKAQLEEKQAILDAALKERADQREHELHQQKMAHAELEHQHKMAQAGQQHGAIMQKTESEHKAAKEKVASVDHVKKLGEALDKHAKAVEEAQSAPVEIIRDKSGRASGIKRGNKTMTIKRGKDGKAEALQ